MVQHIIISYEYDARSPHFHKAVPHAFPTKEEAMAFRDSISKKQHTEYVLSEVPA